ncbi:mediator of RNA polymerase II transcription subunit 14-like isoform X4 [Camellia sinensis]|uniref:mediator of RNA polymerase II transcription subunit 14-like isoform X4 n=1 Tax=Camellia sinensis TaxID=4442 RepID=UPI00103661DF|nr:mediator of RNA polymerase II transcription subunit 14-like isoform X4 [Camellia sinensis]
MRRAFRIEAVGLMSLWFSFGSGVLACFVVEWESGKEGSTMHVSPDQLLPHTKEPVVSRNPLSSLLLTDDKDGLPYKDKENPCLCSLVLGMLLLVF